MALMFLLLSTGFSRKLMQSTTSDDGFARLASVNEKNEGPNTRVMIELDYEDAGPNTNKRSGLIMPTPDPEVPAPQP
ncbi:hypothetical protein Tco_0909345 [Tanacetum coccineum]|uniref:Uncharacterized protein n=1 Tax=Tanacetum coccineum TaxID=301880 RepID=A0ABQ5CPQ1_9ASTR